ncbi:RTA1 like protein-domain-containing protein [Thamnidium elegans]|nr:RTA1 like protein-domain-containing protein [Thamnidium elegans]
MDPIQDSANQYFLYNPSLPLAVIGLIVFALFSVFLFIRIYRSNSRKFLYILPITALMEAIGYLIRALCSTGETTIGKYIGMTFFLLLPPNALALVNYKCLGEVIRLSNVQSRLFFLRPKFVTWFFFASDIFAFMLQGSGGGLQVTDNAAMGKTIALIGLVVQLGFFGSFAVITVYVHRSPKYSYTVEGQINAKKSEYAGGRDGPVATSEWAFYVFDGLAIALSFVGYCVYFMGNYLPKRGEEDAMVSTNISSISSSDNLTRNDIEMSRNNNLKYNGSNIIYTYMYNLFDGLAITLNFVAYCVYFVGDYIPKRNVVQGAAKFSSITRSDPLNFTKNDIKEMGRQYARENFK